MLCFSDVSHSPTEARVSHVTPTTSILSWLPGNSNLSHVICINGRDSYLVGPGVYRYPLSGEFNVYLVGPGTLCQVSVTFT